MDNTLVIYGIFMFIVMVIIVGGVYYLHKAHKITHQNSEGTSLLATVQDELSKKD